MYYFILISTIITLLLSCGQSDTKQKELELRERELKLKEKQLSIDSIQNVNQKTTTIANKPTLDNHAAKNLQTDNSTSNNLDFLNKLNGSYTGALWTQNNIAFTKRLKKLLGNKYETLRDICCVENPIEITNNIFSASTCESHNCGSTNFIIVADLAQNVLYVGIRKDGQTRTFSENGNYSEKLNEWENGN